VNNDLNSGLVEPVPGEGIVQPQEEEDQLQQQQQQQQQVMLKKQNHGVNSGKMVLCEMLN
jgi:hypothetical protein